jgi:hypothetical protein
MVVHGSAIAEVSGTQVILQIKPVKRSPTNNAAFLFLWITVCELPVAKRNFSKRHSHGVLYLARRWGEPADRLLSCQVISDCANEDTPTFSDPPGKGDSENDENKQLVVAETVDSNQYDMTQNEERKLEGVESRDPLFELVTRNLVPWVPPDQESCATTLWETKPTASPARDLNSHWSTWPERTFPCANPSQSMALAAKTLVSRPLHPRVAPLAEPGVRISPEQFELFVDGIDFSKIFDLDGLDFDEF